MKIFASVFAAILLAVIVVWGSCFAAHFSKEKALLKRLNDQAAALSTQDITGKSPEELQDEVTKCDVLELEIRKAERSGSDPFWFIRNEDDMP